MRPSARTLANRRNARASTGPRTAAGKARVAKNAVAHGLTIPIELNPDASERIRKLAQMIAGPDADELRLERARAVAEAEIDLLRVRQARQAVIGDLHARLGSKTAGDLRRALDDPELSPDSRVVAVDYVGGPNRLNPDAAASRLEEAIPVLAAKLERLDRYESRALFRRERAIRAWVALDA